MWSEHGGCEDHEGLELLLQALTHARVGSVAEGCCRGGDGRDLSRGARLALGRVVFFDGVDREVRVAPDGGGIWRLFTLQECRSEMGTLWRPAAALLTARFPASAGALIVAL